MTDVNSPRPLRVLMVDDCADTLRSMATLLRLWGHEAYLAKDGPEALKAAEVFHPDVVMLDIGLPGMNGWEVARRLRHLPGGDGIYLVAVSGFGQQQDMDQSREAGCDRHLLKPIDLEDFQHFLETLTKERVGAAAS